MSDVRVQFVGSGDAFGSGGRFQTCMLLDGSRGKILMDCGASSLIAMRRLGIDPSEISAVLLTHLHGDHFGGVPFLILDGQFSRRENPLLIAGPPGTRRRITETMEALFPGSSGVTRRFPIEIRQLAQGATAAVGPVSVTAFDVDHASGAPAFALRVEYDGKVVAYSGDTAWTDSLVDAAREADLFICEAYYADKSVRYHLDYTTLSSHVPRLTCKRIILTHMSADMLERSDCTLERADDGLVVTL